MCNKMQKGEESRSMKTKMVCSGADSEKAKKKKGGVNFDFLQKLGKVLMTVIAVMPAAGLMLSIGK